MAVTANKISTMLQLKVKTGSDQNGNDILATETFRGVKADANDDDIFAVGSALGTMENAQVVSILKSDGYELVNQA